MAGNDLDVLVVDDVISAAQDYASLLSTQTNLRVECTDDPERALDIVRTSSLKVLVLDQNMPVTGTELFREVRIIDSSVRAVMLTGEADASEVGEAMALGFREYVRKQDVVKRLPGVVLHEYVAYQEAIAASALAGDQPVVYRRRRRLLPWGRDIITYRLRRVSLVHDDYVLPDGWETALTLQVGQTEKLALAGTREDSVVLEEETVDKLTVQLGLSGKAVAELKGQLQSEVTARLKASVTAKATSTASIEQTYELPSEPTNPDELHVKVRRIQWAEVYRRMRVELASECNECMARDITAIDLLFPKGKKALRHLDHLSDGTRRTHNLGFE